MYCGVPEEEQEWHRGYLKKNMGGKMHKFVEIHEYKHPRYTVKSKSD